MITIDELAADYEQRFTRHERADGSMYYSTDADGEDGLTELIYAAHNEGEFFPDDYRYEYIVRALEVIAQADQEDSADTIRESFYEMHADSFEPDTYYTAILAWAASHPSRYNGYCDDAMREFGGNEWITAAQMGQSMERHEVADTVLRVLAEQVEQQREQYIVDALVAQEEERVERGQANWSEGRV